MTNRLLPKLLGLIAVCIASAGCTVQIEQTDTVPTAAPPTATQPEPATATATATQIPASPTATIEGETAVAVTTATAEPTATEVPTEWFGFPFLDNPGLDYEVLTGWEDLGLTGSALFLAFSPAGQSVVAFNFETGLFTPIFVAPENTWVLSASLRPDHENLLLSYAPVPPEGETQYGYTDLYLLTPDGSQTPLLERTEEIESFFSAFYSNAGSEVFFSWFVIDESVDYGFRYHINRLDVGSGEWAKIVDDAFWETLSADDTQLAYVTLDPNASETDPAELRVSSAAGGSPEAALDPEQFPIIDAPFFSPDGAQIYFSAVSEVQPALSWLDILMGVIPASAHTVPSDWWRADLASGAVEQITEIFDQGMFGDFSPAGDRIVFISATGLWVMNPDGSELTQIISSGTFYGNVEWVE